VCIYRLEKKGRLHKFKKEVFMASKLFVGGLPYSTNDDELRDLFAAHGTVESAKVITDRDTGRSKGFGFVEMSNDDEANAAIAALNDTDMGGRKIVVNVARPLEKRAPRNDYR
jgi:RNA recognition motif-containing protein